MKLDAKIDKSDLAILEKKIKLLREYGSKPLSNEIGKTGFAIERRAKRNVVVDLGGLKQSIKTIHSGKKAFVEAGKTYAPYVEFGTGSKVDLSDLKALKIPASYAAQFKGKGFSGKLPVNIKGNWRMVQFPISLPARPFLFPAARIEFLNLLKRITKKLKELTWMTQLNLFVKKL